MTKDFLTSAILEFKYYKKLGEQTIAQVPNDQLSYKFGTETNSINTIVKHLSGNMSSRWTNFLTSDGEKPWRNREGEFVDDIGSKEELLTVWNRGWEQLFSTISRLNEADFNKVVYIRNEGHSVTECINRQLCHYSYHIGQLVLMGKMICGPHWKSLSIPIGQSKQFNTEKFSKAKTRKHFSE